MSTTKSRKQAVVKTTAPDNFDPTVLMWILDAIAEAEVNDDRYATTVEAVADKFFADGWVHPPTPRELRPYFKYAVEEGYIITLGQRLPGDWGAYAYVSTLTERGKAYLMEVAGDVE
jgi:hypothetical protein